MEIPPNVTMGTSGNTLRSVEKKLGPFWTSIAGGNINLFVPRVCNLSGLEVWIGGRAKTLETLIFNTDIDIRTQLNRPVFFSAHVQYID